MLMKTRIVSLVVISLVVALALPQLGQAPVATAVVQPRARLSVLPAPSLGRQLGDVIIAAPPITLTPRAYLPLVQKSPLSCYTGQSYGEFSVAAGGDGDAANHPDKNLALRGYTTNTTAYLGFTFLTGSSDSTAPRLYSLFSPAPTAPFAHGYRVGLAPWDIGAPGWISSPDVTLLGIATTIGTQIRLPIRPNGDHIVAEPSPGDRYYGLVIYAAATRVTIVYTSVDRIALPGNAGGYAIHVENVCVDPTLVNRYNQLSAAGRSVLPGLRYNQPFGVATGTEIKVAIRDNGEFMDPRAYKDWWR